MFSSFRLHVGHLFLWQDPWDHHILSLFLSGFWLWSHATLSTGSLWTRTLTHHIHTLKNNHQFFKLFARFFLKIQRKAVHESTLLQNKCHFTGSSSRLFIKNCTNPHVCVYRVKLFMGPRPLTPHVVVLLTGLTYCATWTKWTVIIRSCISSVCLLFVP